MPCDHFIVLMEILGNYDVWSWCIADIFTTLDTVRHITARWVLACPLFCIHILMENIKAINKTPFIFQERLISVNTTVGTKTPKKRRVSLVRKLAVSVASPGHMTQQIKFRYSNPKQRLVLFIYCAAMILFWEELEGHVTWRQFK